MTTSRLLTTRAAYLAARTDVEAKRKAFILAIRAERERGRTLEDIGAELGMTRQTVSQLERGRI